jgi:hypothetical protein
VDERFGDAAPARSGVTAAGASAPAPLFRIRPSAWASAEQGRVSGGFWIVGELDYRLRRELVWSGGVSAEVTVLTGDGRDVLVRTVEVPAADGGFGLRVPGTATLPSGDYAVRVTIRSPGAADATFSDTARVAVPVLPSALGDAVLWRRGPSTGPRFVMTADVRFRRSDRIRLELPSVLAAPVSVRMLDRMGHPLQVPVIAGTREDADGTRWITAEAALAPLAMGEYAVEVSLGDESRRTTFQIVP